jgi:hypothetical protein
MSMWTDYGFFENPYSTRAIEPNEEGVELLVGRTPEMRRLHAVLTSTDTHASIEGASGVGKTSLAQVTTYIAQLGAERELTPQLLLPLARSFQIAPDSKPESFAREVCYEIVNGFRMHHELLLQRGLTAPDMASVEHWINQPLYRSGSLQLPIGGIGRATSPSTTTGFDEDGFVRTVMRWLEDCFPTLQAGAFVCVVDNLELLETSGEARRFLEVLRDSLLARRGIKWVLCGARGVLRSAVSSRRLSGVIASPVELEPLTPSEAAEGLARRIETYQMTSSYYVPVDPTGFEHLYTILNFNLRDAFKLCQDFAIDLSDRRNDRVREDERIDLLHAWLQGEGRKYRTAAHNVLNETWRVFDRLIDIGGSCALDASPVATASAEEFSKHVNVLARANLVEVVANKDHLDESVVVTAIGWVVHHSRA